MLGGGLELNVIIIVGVLLFYVCFRDVCVGVICGVFFSFRWWILRFGVDRRFFRRFLGCRRFYLAFEFGDLLFVKVGESVFVNVLRGGKVKVKKSS